MTAHTLNDLPAILTASYERNQICIVADKQICDARLSSLKDYPLLPVETDEAHKSLETVQRIWDFLFDHHITRRGLLVCVGGGIITDLGGFAAATYKRGIDYINVPTTLLAMIDASTGGKTGCNYRGLKNAVGAFHAPVRTVICTDWLSTLPVNHFLSGFAEMIKTGLIETQSTSADSLWNALLRYDLDTMPVEALTPLIGQCLTAKERIVAADPHETGLRKTLNFGHTFGHALEEISLTGVAGLTAKRSDSEAVQQRSGLLHGYAVLYGMMAELYLSVTKLGCPREPLQQLTRFMLSYYGKPQCKCTDREQLIELMRQDKKNERTAEINCTLLRDIGEPVINRVITADEAREALDYLFSL